MKRENKQSSTGRVAGLADIGPARDKEPVCNSSEFEIEESKEENRRISISHGGSFKDIAHLKPALDAVLQMKEAETRHFIARWLTILFIVWTVTGLLSYVITGSTWILLTSAGPGALFGSVMYYYFRRTRR